jgi:hypothetical protein
VGATPTRKLVTNFERNINASAEEISVKLREINELIAELDARDTALKEKMEAGVEAGSVAEMEMIEEHMRLMTVKDRHVRQQDYLNTLADLKETEEAINEAKRSLAECPSPDGGITSYNLQCQKGLKLTELMQKKEELQLLLSDKENEDEEEMEDVRRLNMVRQKQSGGGGGGGSAFQRGQSEPLSSSQRLLSGVSQWLRS